MPGAVTESSILPQRFQISSHQYAPIDCVVHSTPSETTTRVWKKARRVVLLVGFVVFVASGLALTSPKEGADQVIHRQTFTVKYAMSGKMGKV